MEFLKLYKHVLSKPQTRKKSFLKSFIKAQIILPDWLIGLVWFPYLWVSGLLGFEKNRLHKQTIASHLVFVRKRDRDRATRIVIMPVFSHIGTSNFWYASSTGPFSQTNKKLEKEKEREKKKKGE